MRRSVSTVVALALAASTRLAAAQAYFNHPNIRVTAAVNHVSTPATYGDLDNRIFLLRQTSTGLQQKIYDHGWSGWTDRPNTHIAGEPPALGSSLVATGGEFFSPSFGIYLPRFRAIQDYIDSAGAIHTSSPFWNWLPTAFFAGEQTPPGAFTPWNVYYPPPESAFQGFQPWSAISWRNGQLDRVNAFGLSAYASADVNATRPCTAGSCIIWYTHLREQWWDGANWRFTDHGAPNNAVEVHMGPSSAVWTNPTGLGQGHVFVTDDVGVLWDRFYDASRCPGWCWVNLGVGSNGVTPRTPVGVTYYWNGRMRVAVFVPELTASGTFHLFGRYTDDGQNWSSWGDYGSPSGMLNYPQRGFDMSSSAVYYVNGSLRISLFGTTDKVDRYTSGISTHVGGEVVGLYWNGGTWVWQGPDSLPGSWQDHTRRFQTMSAATIAGRVSLYGQDELGVTWERFSSDGASWTWQTL